MRQPSSLGGRLPLLDPVKLSARQTEAYDRINSTMVPWAEAAHFQSKTMEADRTVQCGPIRARNGFQFW
jgi:hypothetical protein